MMRVWPQAFPGRSSWTLVGVFCGLLLALWAVFGAVFALLAAADAARARRDVENAAALLAKQMDRTVLSADLALRIASLELARDRQTDVLVRLLRNEQIELGPIVQIAFLNSDGLMVADQNGPVKERYELSGRAYFRAHRDGLQGLAINPPLFGVKLGQWIIPLTRRVEDAEGAMLGVVLGSLNPAYLARFWRQIDPDSVMALRLIDDDGRIYAASGDFVPMLEGGRARPQDGAFLREASEGKVSERLDEGKTLLSAFRRVAGTPLTVVVDRAPPPFWSESVRYATMLGLWASGFMLVLAGWIWRVNLKLAAAESRAVRSEARLRDAIESLEDGFGIVDANRRIVMTNSAMRKFYPGPPEDLHVGADYFDLRRKGRATGRVVDEGRVPMLADDATFEKHFSHPPGARFQRIGDRYVRILETRTQTGDLVSIRTDITELKQREEELRQSRAILEAQARELQDMAAKAEAATQAKSAFVAAMSHEIRTPLNAIVGFGDLLARTDLPPEQKHFAAIIRDSSHHLLRLADDILDFERLGADKVVLKNEPFDLLAGIYGVVDVATGLIGQRPVSIALRLSPDAPERVIGDWLRLKQVLINLVGNAVKFTQEGEVELSVTRGPGARIRFAVRDTGPGVSEEDRRTIFELFEQGSASGPRKGGSGLGLTIARRLVQLMGGDIAVDSRPGQGSTFSFEIDLSAAAPLIKEFTAPQAEPKGGRRRILLADDVASARLLLATLLKMRGHDVLAVEDGLEALAAARAERFDCILLDFQMPNMDGLESARLIRKLPPPNGDAPIFGFSAQVLEQDRMAAAAAGMNGFLPKPLREDALDRMLASLGPKEPAQAAMLEKTSAPASATMP